MVTLAGAPVRLTLHACSAGGATWGVASADVADPARVASALSALRAAAAGNVAAETRRAVDRPVAGATPSPEAGAMVLGGRFPDGRPAQMHVAVFARATVVFQVSVVGERLDAVALDTFFTSLRFTS